MKIYQKNIERVLRGIILVVLSGIVLLGYPQTTLAERVIHRGDVQNSNVGHKADWSPRGRFVASEPKGTQPVHERSVVRRGDAKLPNFGQKPDQPPRGRFVAPEPKGAQPVHERPVVRRGDDKLPNVGHRRDHPVRGSFVFSVPRGHKTVIHRGVPYYFHGGKWYQSYWFGFSVVAPPSGLVVPFLPLSHSTIWIGGFPYYYADDAYYIPSVGGYMVVSPPRAEVRETPPESSENLSVDRLFIYPSNGQTEQQQEEDRYQCHRWSVNEINYDPTQPPDGIPSVEKNLDYQRAMTACLEARGYAVK